MEILWWLAPAGAVTGVAMLWAAWAGRPAKDTPRERSEADYERFAAAIAKEHPGASRPRGPEEARETVEKYDRFRAALTDRPAEERHHRAS